MSSDKLTREGAPWTCPHQVSSKFIWEDEGISTMYRLTC